VLVSGVTVNAVAADGKPAAVVNSTGNEKEVCVGSVYAFDQCTETA